MDRIVGTCGRCGGTVTVPTAWLGIVPPTPTCTSCGAVVAQGPVLPMRDPPSSPRSSDPRGMRTLTITLDEWRRMVEADWL